MNHRGYEDRRKFIMFSPLHNILLIKSLLGIRELRVRLIHNPFNSLFHKNLMLDVFIVVLFFTHTKYDVLVFLTKNAFNVFLSRKKTLLISVFISLLGTFND
jgi:hypothetical protein